MTMDKKTFDEIESIFPKIFNFLESKRLLEEKSEASRYFEFGEYGLAFEDALDACEKSLDPIPDEIHDLFERLGEIMGIKLR